MGAEGGGEGERQRETETEIPDGVGKGGVSRESKAVCMFHFNVIIKIMLKIGTAFRKDCLFKCVKTKSNKNSIKMLKSEGEVIIKSFGKN